MDLTPLSAIFVRPDLTPGEARAVASARLFDAKYLRASGDDRHANGSIYLAGLALDLALKACALAEYPFLRGVHTPRHLSGANRRLWNLVYRDHDLEALWGALPRRQALISARVRAGRSRPDRALRGVLAWTIHVRYSPRSATIEDAGIMVAQASELMEFLR